MSEFLKSAKKARIIMPYMYGSNKNNNAIIKFMEGAKRSWPKEPYNVRYYNWYNSNKVKNALKVLKKIGAHTSVIRGLESNLKMSENIMKKALENKRRENAARKIQRAYKKMFKTNTVPKNLGNVVVTRPMARRIMMRRFKQMNN